MFNIKKKSLRQIDKWLLLSIICLCVYGNVVLYSAYSGNFSEVKTQIISTIIGFCAIILISTMDIDFIKKLAKPIYLIAILMLVMTLFIGQGAEEWGSDSWVSIGPISFQPAEITKIGIIFALARYIEINKENINNFNVLIKVLFLSFLPVGLILMQPDFGTAMVYVVFIAAMLFVAGLSWKWIITLLLIFVAIIPVAYFFFDDYQKNRILDFLDPSRDTSGTGWQQSQGLIAIGSGQFFGRGYMKGTQAQYGYIPEKETDYIFSVLAEELGFLGAIVMIILFTIMLFRMIMIAKNSKDSFISFMTIGFFAMFFIHIFENVGMTIGLMPVTGIPLPFFSSGGTFQLINLIAIGLILSSSMQKQPLDFKSMSNEPFAYYKK
ncbi:MAG: rod shape-determining protein RodA [Tissierellia bacterium]|nr:rod shape-determining protein RodA [Tissierellia bacterium]